MLPSLSETFDIIVVFLPLKKFSSLSSCDITLSSLETLFQFSFPVHSPLFAIQCQKSSRYNAGSLPSMPKAPSLVNSTHPCSAPSASCQRLSLLSPAWPDLWTLHWYPNVYWTSPLVNLKKIDPKSNLFQRTLALLSQNWSSTTATCLMKGITSTQCHSQKLRKQSYLLPLLLSPFPKHHRSCPCFFSNSPIYIHLHHHDCSPNNIISHHSTSAVTSEPVCCISCLSNPFSKSKQELSFQISNLIILPPT